MLATPWTRYVENKSENCWYSGSSQQTEPRCIHRCCLRPLVCFPPVITKGCFSDPLSSWGHSYSTALCSVFLITVSPEQKKYRKPSRVLSGQWENQVLGSCLQLGLSGVSYGLLTPSFSHLLGSYAGDWVWFGLMYRFLFVTYSTCLYFILRKHLFVLGLQRAFTWYRFMMSSPPHNGYGRFRSSASHFQILDVKL